MNCNCNKLDVNILNSKNLNSKNLNNKTLNNIDNAINYKNAQIINLISLKELLNNLINVIQNSFCQNNNCFKKEALNIVEQYINISERTYDSNRLFLLSDTFYGTVRDYTNNSDILKYYPLWGDTGFGGILMNGLDETPPINGTFTYNYNSQNQLSFVFNIGDDVAYLANKIRKSICKSVSVVDGTEIGLQFLFGVNETVNTKFYMTIFSIELGTQEYLFEINYNPNDNDYNNIVNDMKFKFSQYINIIWYDNYNNIIRIIFNAGYTVKIKYDTLVSGNTINFYSYINGLKFITQIINGGEVSANYFAYGYLEFYSTCKKLTMNYIIDNNNSFPSVNPNNENTMEFTMEPINRYKDGYCVNITFNLENFWCCIFKNISNMNTYNMCNFYNLDLKACNTWSILLKNMINCLYFDCNPLDKWRRENVIKNLRYLINLLDELTFIANSHKEVNTVMKNDYLRYINCNL